MVRAWDSEVGGHMRENLAGSGGKTLNWRSAICVYHVSGQLAGALPSQSPLPPQGMRKRQRQRQTELRIDAWETSGVRHSCGVCRMHSPRGVGRRISDCFSTLLHMFECERWREGARKGSMSRLAESRP